MIAAHVLIVVTSAWGAPESPDTAAADLVVPFVNGNASTLFAVLGGVSMVLATSSLTARGEAGGVVRATWGRAAIVLAIGLTLAWLPAPVIVVLHYFGWAMLFAAPLLLAPSWLVGIVAALLTFGGPWVNAAVRQWRFGAVGPGAEQGDLLDGSPLAPLADLTFTGEYPAITWLGYLAVGIVLARLVQRMTRSSAAAGRLIGFALAVAGGAFTALSLGMTAVVFEREVGGADIGQLLLSVSNGGPPGGEWWWQLVAIPHSGTIADMLRGVGVAGIVIGVLLTAFPPATATPRLLAPVRAAGAAPLTIYTVHVLTLTAAGLAGDPWVFGVSLMAGFAAWAIHVAIALALGVLLAVLAKRGPLETLASAFANAVSGGGEGPGPTSHRPQAARGVDAT